MHSDSTPVEEWRPVVGYEGRYEVSNTGRVRSLVNQYGPRQRPRPVVASHNGLGYLRVALVKDGLRLGRYVAHLVAAAFIGPRPLGYQINHIDGVKANNSVTNLEYVTPGDNDRHAYRLGLKNRKGEAHHFVKLTEDAVRTIRAKAPSIPPPALHTTRRYGSARKEALQALAKEYGVSVGAINDVLTFRRWRHIT